MDAIEHYAAIDVFIGVDVGKGEHQAVALSRTGKRLFDKALPNDETRLRTLISSLKQHGQLLLVVDQPTTIGALPVTVARAEGILVACLPGLAMRRIADLHAGEGDASAYRIAGTVLKEAALCDATTTWAASQNLVELDTIGWAHMVDAALQGFVRRRPDMVTAAVSIWCQLALPYYKAPYYRESERGEFIDVAVDCTSESEKEVVCHTFLRHIQVEARTDVRIALLDSLRLPSPKFTRSIRYAGALNQFCKVSLSSLSLIRSARSSPSRRKVI